MYRGIPSKLKPPLRKSDIHQGERAGLRFVRSHVEREMGGEKRDPLTCRKIEEKGIYSVGQQGVRRSTSTNGNRKGNTDKMIEEEYGVSKFQQGQRAETREDSLELGCNTRQNFKKLQKQTTPSSRLRLLRIRSNDSLTRAVSNSAKHAQFQFKIKSLKDQNIYLKELHSQSLTKIEELQMMKAEQRQKFIQEQKVYEKRIELLRSKVDKNKIQISHLFSYSNFDPATLMVKPIIQVQQNSSIMKSIHNNSNIKRGNSASEYGLFQKVNKKIPSETTAFSSQNYKDIAQLF